MLHCGIRVQGVILSLHGPTSRTLNINCRNLNSRVCLQYVDKMPLMRISEFLHNYEGIKTVITK
jgi:hypothetical protein